MGLANSLQKHIANGFESAWSKAPQLPELTINCYKYNKSFVNFVALFGAYALVKTSIHYAKKLKSLQVPLQSTEKMQEKYGFNSWAMIVLRQDYEKDFDYCKILSSKGFNIFLVGQEQNVKILNDRLINSQGFSSQVQVFIVDWQKQARNLAVYDQLLQQVQNIDLSILVLPSFHIKDTQNTLEQNVPPYEVVYMLIRKLSPKLKMRQYTSAIILQSFKDVDQINKYNGVSTAVQSGLDAFGRCIQFQLKGLVEFIVARGRAKNAIAGLGIHRISE